MADLLVFLLSAGLSAPPHDAPPPAAGQESAATATRDGVTLPLRRQAGDRELVLNGLALRKKSIFKVYVAGLYVPAKSSNADRILASDEPRVLVMQFLRGVDAEKMCEAWDEALEANTPEAPPQLRQQFATLCSWMEEVEKGEQFVFAYVPGQGTTVEVRGRSKGTIEGKPFADALFKAWIGPKPGPGEDFKQDLLAG
ncbi:MAG: chalcone isomerase family protein [Gemmatimonadota bacterium]